MKGLGLLTFIRILFSKCLLPDFRLFSKYLRRKTLLSPAPVVVPLLSRIQRSCKEYLRLWTMTFGMRIAMEASLNEVPLVSRFMFIAVHYTLC